MQVFFWLSLFIIFWANIGYPISILILGKIIKRKNSKDYTLKPTVTIMVVAHNEEEVIFKKLNNLMTIDYPKDKIEFLVASDNSTDNTNNIVEKFIVDNPDFNLRLFKAKKRMGKTNAQNEAQKNVTTEFLVMTDANAKLAENSISELMASFVSEEIVYVAGRLAYINEESSETSASEATYWSLDLRVREIESDIQTITAGNGALYACRNADYIDFDPIESHDSAMPFYYAYKGKRAIANHDAVAFEKAGENNEDEFNRKVRMNRRILYRLFNSLQILNVFKYKWFTYFYFGHRTARYLLWLSHLVLLLSNIILSVSLTFFRVVLILHVLILLISFLKQIGVMKNKLSVFIHYYTTTIFAQWYGVINIMTGNAKPFWEKAESTR